MHLKGSPFLQQWDIVGSGKQVCEALDLSLSQAAAILDDSGTVAVRSLLNVEISELEQRV